MKLSNLMHAVQLTSGALALATPTRRDEGALLQKRIPYVVYSPGELTVPSSGSPFLILDNDVSFVLQNADANFVV